MDISLGNLGLTKNQMTHLPSFSFSKVKGFKEESGAVIVTTSGPLTDPEISGLKSALAGLPDSKVVTRLDELKGKPVLSVPEITEVLKIAGIL